MQNNHFHHGYLYIHGAQFEKFLQGQLTCDLRNLTITPVLAAHCNAKGRIISLFWIYRHRDGVLLQMPADLLEIAIKHLNQYRVFFKATIDTVDEPSDLPSMLNLTRLEKIEKKIPTVFAATSELFLPHRINLTDFSGVSFNKGCYTGQEIIARMEHRGEVKHHLYPAITAEVFQPGQTLKNGAVIVDCVMGSVSPIALVTMKDEDALPLQNAGIIDLTKETL
jgi:folate-binding protein YgfZ